jgi:hypothetical protein
VIFIFLAINAGDAFTAFNPRQNILSAPYSIKSKTADNSMQFGGLVNEVVTLTNMQG